MTLGEKQQLFVELEAQWVGWVLSHPGWKLRHGEGRILQKGADDKGRKAQDAFSGKIVKVIDLVHLTGGAHYNGVGADWLLFVNGNHVTQSDDPAWIACGEHWEGLHELCRWGGRFEAPRQDGNHISLEHQGFK